MDIKLKLSPVQQCSGVSTSAAQLLANFGLELKPQFGQYSGTVVCSVGLQQASPVFQPAAQLDSFYVRSPHVCVCFIRVLLFPPIIQRHAG